MARHELAKEKVKQQAIRIAKANPGMKMTAIAERLGVTPRQVAYWLEQAEKKKPSA